MCLVRITTVHHVSAGPYLRQNCQQKISTITCGQLLTTSEGPEMVKNSQVIPCCDDRSDSCVVDLGLRQDFLYIIQLCTLLILLFYCSNKHGNPSSCQMPSSNTN